MLTKLDLLQQIAQITEEGDGYTKEKISLQKMFPKSQIADKVKSLDNKRKRCGDRVAKAKHLIHILETIPAEVMVSDRNALLIKLTAIQEREPIDEETGEKYTTDARKNPVIAKKIAEHYAMYKYDKLQKQYRSLTLILRP